MSSSRRQFTVARAFNQLLHLIFPALLIAIGASAAQAQSSTLRDGMRVSITTPSAKELKGIVKSVDQDSVHLYSGEHGALLAVANSDITSVRVSQGKSKWAGATRGGLWGAGIGAGLAAAMVPFVKEGNSDNVDINELRAEAAIQLVMGGFIWGAMIGSFVQRERWETISIRPNVTSTSSSVGLGFSLTSRLLH